MWENSPVLFMVSLLEGGYDEICCCHGSLQGGEMYLIRLYQVPMVPVDFQRTLGKFSKVLVDNSTEWLADPWNKGSIVVIGFFLNGLCDH